MQPQMISWENVSRYIYRHDSLIVDLREPEAYKKGHVTGAWNIPYENVEEQFGKMGNYEQVIFYCTHGNQSLAAAKALAKLGKRAFSVAGGYESGGKSGNI